MFYVVEIKYTGLNPDQHLDQDVVEIQTVQTQGWCGTSQRVQTALARPNDWSVNAHGEYATLTEAETAVKEIFGDELRGELGSDLDASAVVVKAYKLGSYITMSEKDTRDWCYDVIQSRLTLGMAGEQVEALINEMEEAANEEEGYTPLSGAAVESMIKERQDELLAEAEEWFGKRVLTQHFRDMLGSAETIRDLLDLIVGAKFFGCAETLSEYLAAKAVECCEEHRQEVLS